MDRIHDRRGATGHSPRARSADTLLAPGKHTLTEALPVQRREASSQASTAPAEDPAHVHAAAEHGIAGPSGPLPHLDRIQQLFGRHDVSHIQAHVGGPAADASRAIGAEAYATGNHVAFASSPGLHTAAHEAAHAVQQRGGVQLQGGVGQSGDTYEHHADQVADLVVRGQSAESLLDRYVGPSGGSPGTQMSVQRYTKHGNVRVSNQKALVVVDGAPHNTAYATAAKIQDGAQRLGHSESHVTLTEGAALAPADVGLQNDQVQPGLKQVVPQLTSPSTEAPQDAAKQNDDTLVTAELYEALAKNVIASLPGDRVTASETTLIDDMENGAAKERVAQVYRSLDGDYNPTKIASAAQKFGLEPRYVRLIMERIIAYRQQIKGEIRGGGFTAPRDCGQMARAFIRGGDVRYHKLTAEEQEQKGYSGHYFASVLEDAPDIVSLENAVGGSKYEQLWKTSNFDAMWHFEMRGTDVEADDDRETHGVGESKQQHLRAPEDAQRTIDTMREQQATKVGEVSAKIMTSPEATADKNKHDELGKLDPKSAADYERQRDLLIGALAYANEHISGNDKGSSKRVKGWLGAIQAVIDRGGQNEQLAAQVLERMKLVKK